MTRVLTHAQGASHRHAVGMPLCNHAQGCLCSAAWRWFRPTVAGPSTAEGGRSEALPEEETVASTSAQAPDRQVSDDEIAAYAKSLTVPRFGAPKVFLTSARQGVGSAQCAMLLTCPGAGLASAHSQGTVLQLSLLDLSRWSALCRKLGGPRSASSGKCACSRERLHVALTHALSPRRHRRACAVPDHCRRHAGRRGPACSQCGPGGTLVPHPPPARLQAAWQRSLLPWQPLARLHAHARCPSGAASAPLQLLLMTVFRVPFWLSGFANHADFVCARERDRNSRCKCANRK